MNLEALSLVIVYISMYVYCYDEKIKETVKYFTNIRHS